MSVETVTTTEAAPVAPTTHEQPQHLQESKPTKWKTSMINPQAPLQSAHPTSMSAFNEEEGEENESEEKPAEVGEESEEDKSEEPVKETKPEDKRSERLSKTLNEIARQQSELRKERKELEEQKKKLSGSSFDELKAKASDNPLEAIEALGLDYNKLTEFVLNGSGEKSASKKLEEKIQQLEKKLTERDDSESEKQATAKIDQFKTNIKNELSSQTDKYELINTGEEYDTVYEVILQCHQQTGKMLSLDEAAELVENNLEKNLQAQLERLSKTQKAKKWGFLKDQESAPVDSASSEVTPNKDHATEIAKNFVRSGQSPKTITGQMVGQSTTIRKRPLTREEAIANAARMIEAAKTD